MLRTEVEEDPEGSDDETLGRVTPGASRGQD